jgi:hypothetical protein
MVPSVNFDILAISLRNGELFTSDAIVPPHPSR